MAAVLWKVKWRRVSLAGIAARVIVDLVLVAADPALGVPKDRPARFGGLSALVVTPLRERNASGKVAG